MCAPLTPPATYTPKVTAIATTPSPKQMSTKVPRNSADSSPQTVCRQRAVVARAVADISPPLSSRAIWTLGYLLGRGAGWPANAGEGEGEWTMNQRLLRPGGRSISSDDTHKARCPCSFHGPFGGLPPSLAA